MFAIEQQQAAEMDHSLAIQLEFLDRSAASRSQADEVAVIRAPGEMLVPIVMPRMNERNLSPRRRIEGVRFVGFGTVAPLTG